jgi:hypothetical protein
VHGAVHEARGDEQNLRVTFIILLYNISKYNIGSDLNLKSELKKLALDSRTEMD